MQRQFESIRTSAAWRCSLLVLGIVLATAASAAAAGPEDAAAMSPKGLQALDWFLIGLYLVTTLAMGAYYASQQRDVSEYFVGSGSMNPLLIGVSLFATLLSTISYLSMPGEAAGKGPVMLVGMLAYPFIYLVVAYGLIPVYMRQRVTSAYELLEERLGLSVRLLAACMFLALRLVWMTLLIYLAAKALVVIMGVDDRWIPYLVFVTGMVSVIYTTMGGLRAVVVTDLMQSILLFGGALLVVITVSIDFGGVGWIPTSWQPNWDTQPIFSFDPKTRVTVVGTVLSIFVWYVSTSGGDQTCVQRFMATEDAAAARRALATQLTVGAIVSMTLYLVGFALLGYFRTHTDALPAQYDLQKHADLLFPRYISFHLPVGVSGLVVAAMFAAAMSSMDSGVNSVTAVVMTDFLDRFGLQPKTERGHVRVARAVAFGIGAAIVFGSYYMKYIEGNITEVTGKTVNLLAPPIFCLFIFALFVKRATPIGAWAGTLCGIAAAVAVAFSGPLVAFLHFQFGVDPATFNVELLTRTDPATGEEWTVAEDPISFQYMGPISIVVDLVVGTLVSYVTPARKRDGEGTIE